MRTLGEYQTLRFETISYPSQKLVDGTSAKIHYQNWEIISQILRQISDFGS
jgi:hypothetical protein